MAPGSQPAALITGSATRVGKAIALTLAREGVSIAVHYHRSRERADATCSEIQQLGVDAAPFAANLSQAGAATELFGAAHARFPGLDTVVSSAANFDRIPFSKLDLDAWERALCLNARAGYELALAAAPILRRARGSLIFITCASTQTPMRNYLPYIVSKAAVLQLMKGLSLELAPEVRVNAVAPGTVLPPEDMGAAALKRLQESIPLERFGSAEDIAEAVSYLRKAPFVNGHELIVDGGRSVAKSEVYG